LKIADNAIPIKSWFNDPNDTALLNLLPMLDALRFVSDVRSVLSRNREAQRIWLVTSSFAEKSQKLKIIFSLF